jgi:thiamine pyrophosphokinase
MDYSKATVILADGAFPESIHVQQILRQAARIIACDGAAKTVAQWGREPDWIAGDLDSLDKNLQELWSDRVLHISEQETNDLNKAFCCALKMTAPEEPLLILGATGKREDHTLGNIGWLMEFARQRPDVQMITDTGIFLPVLCSGTFSCRPGQAVSIFNPNPCLLRVSSKGLKYPLNDLALNSWWTATLNVALGNSFSLEFDASTGALIIFLARL